MGPTAVVFSLTDPVAVAKTLTDYAKDVPAIKLKAGLVEGRAIAAEQIKDIASMPSCDRADREAPVPAAVADHPLRPRAGGRPAVVRAVLDQVRTRKKNRAGSRHPQRSLREYRV